MYGVFPPHEARRITRKLEFHYTPKHGSWLNMAECEFAVLAGQCLDRRIPHIEVLREEIAAWQGPRNQLRTKIHWQFSTDMARTKLKRLYPAVELSLIHIYPYARCIRLSVLCNPFSETTPLSPSTASSARPLTCLLYTSRCV